MDIGKGGRGMTSFGLRMAAVITMLVDHVGVCVLACTPYQTLGTVMRSIGRMSFPLFAFLVVTGCAHTRSRRRYFGRMMALAVLSQLPYAIFTSLFSHPAAPVEGIVISWLPAGEMLGRLLLAAVCLWCWWSRYNERGLGDPVGWLLCAALGVMACPVSLRWGWLTLPGELNIFYQLGLGIYLFSAAERAGREGDRPALLLPGILAAFLLPEGYGLAGTVLLAALVSCRSRAKSQATVVLLWGICYHLVFLPSMGLLVYCLYALGTAVGAGLVALYNGKPGPRTGRLFYWIYPLQFLVISAVARQTFF